jgi:LacI family transcriptional regulator
MRVTLQDVAREAGVSPATASRVLGGHAARFYVPSTRQRIKEAAERLGYRPSFAARALATGRTSLVTLWSYHPYEPFFAAIMEGMQKQAQERGYGLLVADAAVYDPDNGGSNTVVWPSDGILAMDCGEFAQRVLQSRPSTDTPIVSMGTTLVPDTDAVQLDLFNPFRQATEHLVAQGCRRIAYFGFDPGDDNQMFYHCYRAPREAYQAVLREAGLTEEFIPLETDTRAGSRRTLLDYVGKHKCPDGILCRDDETALGTYRALCDLGLRVGRDVLLIGCDGIQDTQYLECPLSTIVMPIPRMCEIAWQFLARRMADPSIARQHVVLEPALTLRESSQRVGTRKRSRRKGPA